MEFYRTEKAVPDLEDSYPTEQFIRRFNELCDVMNSSGPAGAIRKENDKLKVRQIHENYKGVQNVSYVSIYAWQVMIEIMFTSSNRLFQTS
jgi:hypothetical protein